MEGHKRLSIALAGAGLLAALAVALVGRQATPLGGDVGAVAAELDAVIREAAAAVQARADTLAQLPRLGWAVATDEDTVRDMTTEELAFRTRPGEHIEIANMPKGGQEVRHLLRLPPDASFAMPMSPGSHLFLDGGKSHVVAVVAVEPRQRADELSGLLAVSRVLETAAVEQRLEARGVHAELRLREGSLTLGAPTPAANGTPAKTTLTSPSAGGVELSVVWPGGRPAVDQGGAGSHRPAVAARRGAAVAAQDGAGACRRGGRAHGGHRTAVARHQPASLRREGPGRARRRARRRLDRP